MIKHIKRFFDDVEVLEDIGADALNVDTDSEHRFVTDKDISSWNKKVDSDGGSTAKNTVVFEEAKKRENITSGESHEKLFGKIQKVITDLHSLAFSGNWKDVVDKPTIPSGAAANYAVVDNDTTNNASFLPTARVVYEHGQEIDQLGRDLTDARTSFRAGCSTVAAAITEMGVPTASNAAPEVMATNIKSIKTGTVLLSNVKLDASRSSGSSSSENNISGGASLYLTLSVSDYKTLELGAYTKSSDRKSVV